MSDTSQRGAMAGMAHPVFVPRNPLVEPQDPLLVPPKEAWRLLGIGPTTGYKLIAEGKLEVVKIGRGTRLTMRSIRALAATGA